MDLDEAWHKWLCFHCGEGGHIAWDCPKEKDQKFQVRQLWQGLSDEDCAKLSKDFQISPQ